jgi:hypothetical protein
MQALLIFREAKSRLIGLFFLFLTNTEKSCMAF